MTAWSLAILAFSLLGYAAVSRRLEGTVVTAAMVFVGIGLLVGPEALDRLDAPPTGHAVRILAEATLTLVLFGDASRIDLRALRREYAVPARLLGIGLPLTIVAGALAAAALFSGLTFIEAVVVGILLAPTDAALGQAVVTLPSLPSRIRQGLNVESGLNDGICVPLLLIALAAAETQADLTTEQHAIDVVLEAIGYGILGGVVAGGVGAAVVVFAGRRGLIAPSWLQIVPVAAAALAYGIANPLGGSGFIAAFVGGAVFGGLRRRGAGEDTFLLEQVGGLLNAVTFLLFGAVLLGPSLGHLTWQVVLYAVLSLTVVRMLPVALAVWRTRRNAGDRRLSRLVRPARPRLDRVRGDRRRGGAPPAHRHDPGRDLRDRRPFGPPPRRLRRPARRPLRTLVPLATTRAPAADGERLGRASALALGPQQLIGQRDLEEADEGADGRADHGAHPERGEVRVPGLGELEAVHAA